MNIGKALAKYRPMAWQYHQSWPGGMAISANKYISHQRRRESSQAMSA